MNRREEIKDEIEKKMDARDRVRDLLKKLHDQGKQIPNEYLPAWNQYLMDPRPWRELPGIHMKIRKICKRFERNEKLSPERKKKIAIEALDKTLRKMGIK